MSLVKTSTMQMLPEPVEPPVLRFHTVSIWVVSARRVRTESSNMCWWRGDTIRPFSVGPKAQLLCKVAGSNGLRNSPRVVESVAIETPIRWISSRRKVKVRYAKEPRGLLGT